MCTINTDKANYT